MRASFEDINRTHLSSDSTDRHNAQYSVEQPVAASFQETVRLSNSVANVTVVYQMSSAL